MTNGNATSAKSVTIQMYGMFNRSVSTKVNRTLIFETTPDARNWITTSSSRTYESVASTECAVCGEEHHVHLLTKLARVGYICDSCKKDYTRVCDDCGELMIYDHPKQSTMSVVGRNNVHKIVCIKCAIEKYSQCEVCGLYHYSNSCYSYENKTMCPSCADYYTSKRVRCSVCGDLVLPEMRIDGACPSCFKLRIQSQQHLPEKEIRSYGKTNGTAFFSTEGGVFRHYGCEWEGENGKNTDDQEESLLQKLWQYKECELKSDSSVSKGFEIATYPLGLGYHKQHFHWRELLKLLEEYGFEGHDCPTAGFHIHISKIAFGDTPRKQARNIAAFTYLVQRPDWRTQMKKFSRRNNKAVKNAMENGRMRYHDSDPWHYCKFYREDYAPTGSGRTKDYGITHGYQNCLEQNKRDRNMALNFYDHNWSSSTPQLNKHTVELRLNKSTMKADTVFAMIELCDVFLDIATAKWTEASLRALTWKDMCYKIPSTSTELKAYLKKMNLWED